MTAPTPEQMRDIADGVDACDHIGDVDALMPEVTAALRAAADEVDRLRAVIENAPHWPSCVHYAATWQTIGDPCTCWKADAL